LTSSQIFTSFLQLVITILCIEVTSMLFACKKQSTKSNSSRLRHQRSVRRAAVSKSLVIKCGLQSKHRTSRATITCVASGEALNCCVRLAKCIVYGSQKSDRFVRASYTTGQTSASTETWSARISVTTCSSNGSYNNLSSNQNCTSTTKYYPSRTNIV